MGWPLARKYVKMFKPNVKFWWLFGRIRFLRRFWGSRKFTIRSHYIFFPGSASSFPVWFGFCFLLTWWVLNTVADSDDSEPVGDSMHSIALPVPLSSCVRISKASFQGLPSEWSFSACWEATCRPSVEGCVGGGDSLQMPVTARKSGEFVDFEAEIWSALTCTDYHWLP